MSRQKKYNEAEVAEKAMHLFWKNGYSNTSARMLEKEMGINLFSIYASFQNKGGILLAGVKLYKQRLRLELLHPLKVSTKNIDNLKKYFHDFLQFTSEQNNYKGCLLINTANELGHQMKNEVAIEIISFSQEIKNTFTAILAHDSTKSEQLVQQEADYLLSALQGIALASKMLQKEQVNNYIEMTFKAI